MLDKKIAICVNETEKIALEEISNELSKVKWGIEEKNLIKNIIQLIENGQVSIYKPDDETKKLVDDIDMDKICCIISRDAKTFLRINKEDRKTLGLIAGKIPIYTLDGEINTISEENRFKLNFINISNMKRTRRKISSKNKEA